MEFLCGGVGDAFSTKSWGTHFFVREKGFVLAVDCPDSYRRALEKNAFVHGDHILDVGDIDVMLITHLHGDHVNGLEMVLAYRKFVTEKKLEIFTTPEVAELLWTKRLEVSLGTLYDGELYQKMSLDDFANLTIIDWETPIQCGPFEIQTRQTIHHIPTSALKISAGNSKLGYSCDSAFDPSLIDWLRDSDMILHETSFGAAHTPLFSLLELDEDIREKMWLVHLPDSLLNEEVEGLNLAFEGFRRDV